VDEASHPDLTLGPRRAELGRLGFTILEEGEDQFTAARSGQAGTRGDTRLTIILCVRRVTRLDHTTIDRDQQRLLHVAPELLKPLTPWRARDGRAVLLVYLADSADPGARRFALAQRRVFSAHLQAGILEADGTLTHTNRIVPNVWPGQPQMDWVIGRVLDPGSPDPGEPVSASSSLAWRGRGNPVLLVIILILMVGYTAFTGVLVFGILAAVFGGLAAMLMFVSQGQ
jgi:hypothetical protein